MSRDPTLDPSWYEITRFRPAKQDFETLLTLLKHHHWEVRWNAAREFFFEGTHTHWMP